MSACDGLALAKAAEQFIGCNFRLRGRDPAIGLDCVGVVLAALANIGRHCLAPANYQLRMRDVSGFTNLAEQVGLIETPDTVRPGDVLLLKVGPCQHHCAIALSDGGFVHAHASLRRVVHTPDRPEGILVRHWRLAP